MRVQEGFVMVLATLNYLIACAVAIFCAPLFIISNVAQELQIWMQQPEAESPSQVSQWSVWAYTVLLILAALIARCHDKLVHDIALGCRAVGHRILSCFSRRGQHPHSRTEHGAAEFTETLSNNPTNPLESSAEITPITAPASASPFRDGQSKPTINQRTIKAFRSFYKNFCDPLNQSGKDPIEEA